MLTQLASAAAASVGVFPSAWDGHSPLTVLEFLIFMRRCTLAEDTTTAPVWSRGWGVSDRETLEDMWRRRKVSQLRRANRVSGYRLGGQKRGGGQPPDGVLLPGAPEGFRELVFST